MATDTGTVATVDVEKTSVSPSRVNGKGKMAQPHRRWIGLAASAIPFKDNEDDDVFSPYFLGIWRTMAVKLGPGSHQSGRDDGYMALPTSIYFRLFVVSFFGAGWLVDDCVGTASMKWNKLDRNL